MKQVAYLHLIGHQQRHLLHNPRRGRRALHGLPVLADETVFEELLV